MAFANPNPNADRDALILDWQAKRVQLEALKEAELIARNKVVGHLFEEYTDKEGTENIDIGGGYKLKLVFAQNFNVPSAEGGKAVKEVIAQLEKLGDDGKFIAERLFKWKPEVSKTEYKALPPSMKRIANKVITTKAAQPTIEIIAPKAV